MSSTNTILIVTIDTEEDNWGQHRSGITVENVRKLPRLQNLFDRYGIKPTYLVSYQVTLCEWAVDILSEILLMSKCEIGAHLHPWNTPPLREKLNARNSMLNNLPYELQLEKLGTLTDQIEKAFGIRPQSFRAGRWGLGLETVEALIAWGYRIDTSVTPMISWETEGDGPSYENMGTDPYWLQRKNVSFGNSHKAILEIPVTIGFNRWPFEFWQKIHCLLRKDWLKPLRPIGLFHHIGLIRKTWLSPEISSASDMITLSKVMIKHAKRILNLTFHSSSLMPAKGPFVNNKKELEQFYSRLEKVLECLSTATNLMPLTLSEVGRLFESKGM